MTHDVSQTPPATKRFSRKAVALLGVLLLAGTAIAAVSTNFILDPGSFTQGGDTGTSTNFIAEGAIGADQFTTDYAGGNDSGTSTSTNFILNGGFGGSLGGGAGTSALSVFNGPVNPGATNEIATTTATIPMQQVVLTAGATQTATIQSVTFTAGGTGDDVNDLAAGTPVDCIVDTNANGVVDLGELAFAPATAFGADNGTATFTPAAAVVLNPGSSITLLLTYAFNGSGTPGTTFFSSIAVGGITAVDGSSNPIVPNGLPRIGNTKTLVGSGGTGSLTVALGSGTPSGTVEIGAAGQAWMLIELTASSAESIRVSGLTLTASGSLDDSMGLDSVTLFDDFPGSAAGQLDPGDAFIASGNYPGDDGRLTFNFASPRIVPAGGKLSWLVVYDISSAAVPGASGTCSIASNADISATGLSSLATITATGAPIGAVRVIGNPPLSTVTVTDSGGCVMVSGPVENANARWLGMLLTWMGLLSVLMLRRRRA